MTDVLSDEEINRARQAFIDAHEGIEPRYEVTSVAGDPSQALAEMGKLAAVEYLTDRGDGPEIRRHDFRPGTMLAFDKDGYLIIVGDAYTVGRDGIEDK